MVDTRNARMEKFDLSGQFLRQWALPSSGVDQIVRAFDTAVDGAGNVYATQFLPPLVLKFDGNGNPIGKAGQESITGPNSIAVDGAGDLIVLDVSQNVRKVKVLGPGGQLRYTWGTIGPRPGQFGTPCGIAADADGHVYIGDLGNNRVQEYDLSGTPIAYFETDNAPCYVALDGTGGVYVSAADGTLTKYGLPG